jgi:hypothetical protein
MPKTGISSTKITNRSLQSFISNHFRQGLQSLLDQTTHWLADIPKIIFAKTPLELDYTDKNFWTAHFTAEIESLKAELLEGLILKKELQDRLVELQGIIGKHTLSPVVYHQCLLELQAFLIANKELTRHADVVAHILQDFKIALHEQVPLVRECFEGDSQLWLQQLVQPGSKAYAHIIRTLIYYQTFTVPGVYLSLLLQFRQQAVPSRRIALIQYLTGMIFSLEHEGVQPVEEMQKVEKENDEIMDENEGELPAMENESAKKKGLLDNAFNTIKSWGEYILNHPGQAITLGLAMQTVAAAAFESSLTMKKETDQARTLLEDIQQAAQRTPFDKLGQELAVGLASTAQKMPDSSIQLLVAKVNTQLKNMRAVRTDNKGGDGAAPNVAGLNNDGFVVVEQLYGIGVTYEGNYNNIFGYQYDPTNDFVNYTQAFQVNNFTAYTQASPVVTGLSGGGFAVAWQSFNQTSDPGCVAGCWDIYARTYNNSAISMQAKEFLVNTNYTHLDQSQPAIANLNNGGFIVGWHSFNDTTDGYDVYVQRYNATSGPLDNGGFKVNTYIGLQTYPAIAGLNNGDFVVTWQGSSACCTDCYSIYLRQYNTFGSSLSNQALVSSSTLCDSRYSAITSLQGGGFIITWQGTANNYFDDYVVYGQLYDSSGGPQGTQFQVGNGTDPSVAGLNNGGFVVAWNNNQTGFSYIYAREYNASGSPIAVECPIDEGTIADNQLLYPVVASLKNGDFTIVWQDQSYSFDYLLPGFSLNSCAGMSSTSTTTTPSSTTTTSTSATSIALTATATSSTAASTGTTNPTSAISSTTTMTTSSMNGIAATTVLGTTTATTSESTTSIALATTATSSATTAASIGTITTNPSSSTTGTANPTAATSVSNTVSTTAGIITAIGSTTSIETLATSGLPNVGSSTSNNSQSKNNTIGIAVGAAGGGIIIASAIALGIWKCKQKAKNYSRQSEQRQDEPGTSLSNLKTVDAY